MTKAARQGTRRWRVGVTAAAWVVASLALSAIAHSQQRDGGARPTRVITLSTGHAGARTDWLASEYAGVLARLAPTLRDCYEDALTHHPAARGALRLIAPVGPSGKLADVAGRRSETLPAELKQCVGARLMSVAFPPPEGGGAVIRQDVVFLPRLAARTVGADAASTPQAAFEADWTERTAPRMPLTVLSHGEEPTAALIRALRADVMACTVVQVSPRRVGVALVVSPNGAIRDLDVRATPDLPRVTACVRKRIMARKLPLPGERAWVATLRFAIRNGGVYLERE